MSPATGVTPFGEPQYQDIVQLLLGDQKCLPDKPEQEESETARSGGLLVQEAWGGGCPRLKVHLEWRPHRAALLTDEGAGEGRVQEVGP